MYGGPISGRYYINGGMPAPQSRAIDGPMVARYYYGYINRTHNLSPSSVYTNIPWFYVSQTLGLRAHFAKKNQNPTDPEKIKSKKSLHRASRMYV